MYDLVVSPGMGREALRVAEAAITDRGRTEDAPLRIKIEGTHDLMVNDFPLRSLHRVIDARGAVFQGTGLRKANRDFAGLANGHTIVCEGGSVVAADVVGFGGPTVSEQLLVGMTFSDYLGLSQDGLGCSGAEGSTMSISRSGIPSRDRPWKTTLDGVTILDWVGTAGTTHPTYLHGRPGEFHIINSVLAGGQSCSLLKTTRSLMTVRKSKLYSESCMVRGEPPQGISSAGKMIDVPSGSTLIVSGVEFHVSRHQKVGGTTNVLWRNPRRSLWSSDEEMAPSDIVYQKGALAPFMFLFTATKLGIDAADSVYVTLTSLETGESRIVQARPVCVYSRNPRPINNDLWEVTISPDEVPVSGRFALGIERADGGRRWPYTKPILTVFRDAEHLMVSSFAEATPEKVSRYALPDYWETLGDLDNPENPNTIKAFISGCLIKRHHNPLLGSQRPKISMLRVDGTYPIDAVKQFSLNSKAHPVPANWKERAVMFEGDNTFEGWTDEELVEDKYSAGRWSFREGYDEVWGTGGTILMDPPEPLIIPVAPIEEVTRRLPEWFRR